MTAPPWPDHLLTLEESAALPEDDSRRYELQDGVVIVTPRAAPLHQKVAYRLPVEYANARIPHSWVIDLEYPVSLATYHLAGDLGYRASPVVTGMFSTSEPFALDIDLVALTEPRTSGGKKVGR